MREERTLLRKAFVLLGLAVLLSLLFPLKVLLVQTGVDPVNLHVPGADLAALCVLVALLPAMLMFRDGRLEHRIPRWSLWVGALGLCSLVFLLLHVNWSLDLATAYAREAIASGGLLPASISHVSLLDGIELTARLGVLVALVGVLMHLDAPVQEEAPAPRRKRREG
jgi:uncharacterized membrane protein YbhN (UPF0104 family)